MGSSIALAGLLAFVGDARLFTWLMDEAPPRVRYFHAWRGPVPLQSRLWIACMCALIVALPEIVWQAWKTTARAITPAQHRMRERLLPLAALAPVAGVAVGYLVVLPWITHSAPPSDDRLLALQPTAFVTSCVWWLMVSAAAFELPVFLAGLGPQPREGRVGR